MGGRGVIFPGSHRHGGGHTAAAQVNGDVRSGQDPKHQKRLVYTDIRNYLAKNNLVEIGYERIRAHSGMCRLRFRRPQTHADITS